MKQRDQSNDERQYSLSQRLRRRKDVLQQRKCIVDISFALGLLGKHKLVRVNVHNLAQLQIGAVW
jgi:hypothetical protein